MTTDQKRSARWAAESGCAVAVTDLAPLAPGRRHRSVV
jgi:hypothetical protein